METLDYSRLFRWNLASFYLLPAIGLNVNDFGGFENFVNCYAATDGSHLYVAIHSPEFCDLAKESQFFVTEKSMEDETGEYFLIFFFPPIYDEDFVKFYAGEYSKFSEEFKELIRKFSGLSYRTEYEEGKPTRTDCRLLAISTNKIDRQTLSLIIAETLGINPPDIAEELLPPPKFEVEFFDLDF